MFSVIGSCLVFSMEYSRNADTDTISIYTTGFMKQLMNRSFEIGPRHFYLGCQWVATSRLLVRCVHWVRS